MSAPSSRPRRDTPARPAPNGWQHRTTLCTIPEVFPTLERVIQAMTSLGYSERDCFGMKLALEEVLTNAIKHGNCNDPSKHVHFCWNVEADQVIAEVEDQGPGFDPAKVADPTAPENLEQPGGRGLLLVRCYTSWVNYNDRGNRVTLCKRRSDAHPSCFPPGKSAAG